MDYHILTQSVDRKTANVVFHIPIPSSLNSAGISWQDAIVKDQGGSANISSVLPELSGTQEETDLMSGILFEYPYSLRFSSININNAQRLTEIEEAYTAVAADLITEKQITLDFMGKEGNV